MDRVCEQNSASRLGARQKNEFCFRPRAACKWRSYDPRSPRSQLHKIFLFSRQNGVGMGLGGVGLGAGSLSNQYSREPCLAADATKCISLARSTHVHAFALFFSFMPTARRRTPNLFALSFFEARFLIRSSCRLSEIFSLCVESIFNLYVL